jgi:hypothetical protein
MAKTATRQVSIFLNGKEVENSIKAIGAEQKKANAELARMIIGTDEYVKKAADVQRLNGILAEHRQGLNGIKQGLDLNKAGLDKFIGLAAGAFTVDAVIGYGKELFNTAVQMEAMSKKAKIVFGEALPAVTEEAKKSATAMGFTTSQYIAAAAAIQDILVPMGFQRKQAAEISTQLVNLSGALSEWTGGQVSAAQVSDILSSALTGEREQLKQLGIVLQQADIDARLAEKGQAKLEGTLRQQAEAAATLELILEKSQDAQISYAENADTMARKTAELSARFEEIKERLANALVPVFEAFVNVMEDAGDGFASFIGLLEDPKWGDTLKRFLTPFLGIGGGSLLTRLFGTKEEVAAVKTEVDKLVEDTDALLAKYGVAKNGPPVIAAPGPKEIEEKKRAAEKAARAKEREDKIREKEAEEQRLYEIEQSGINALKGLRVAQDQARRDARATFLQEEKDGLDENLDAYDQYRKTQELIDTGYLEGKKATQEKIDELTKSDLTKQVEVTEEQYRILLELAEQYGLDLTALKVTREQEEKDALEAIRGGPEAGTIAAVNDEYAEILEKLNEHYDAKIKAAKENAAEIARLEAERRAEAISLDAEANVERLEVYQSAFNGIANSLVEAFSLFSDSQSKFAAFQKGIAIFQIAIDTARAISGIVAAAASTSLTPIDLAIKIASGTAIIIANIAKAKKLLDAPVPVKQKFTGGYTEVIGETDGRTYRPQVIGAPSTGLLPNHPVLFQSSATGAPVLASERGREYFVANKDLANPSVANYVRLIDDIVTSNGARVRQFADGGLNAATTAAPAPTPSADAAMMREMANNLALNNQLLNYLIANGVVAVVPDGTVIGINDRLKTLQKVSGNFF